MPRLAEQIKEALAAFAGIEQPPALIGGLALAAHQVIRATEDVDFLVDGDEAERLHGILIGLGYTCIHRSENAANDVRGDEGLDLLYAHRPIARRLLQEAEPRDTAMGRLRVITAEGLIAEPVLVREAGVPYRPAPAADPFERWLELMEVAEALCPQWPARAPTIGRDYRL